MKKKASFFSIDEYFLIRFLKDQKLFVKEANLRELHLLLAGN